MKPIPPMTNNFQLLFALPKPSFAVLLPLLKQARSPAPIERHPAFKPLTSEPPLSIWGSDADGMPQTALPAEAVALQQEMLAEFPVGSLVESWIALVGHVLASDELRCPASSGSADCSGTATIGIDAEVGSLETGKQAQKALLLRAGLTVLTQNPV